MVDLIFDMKKDDTFQSLRAQLKYQTTTSSAPVNLDGATGSFSMHLRGSRKLTVDNQLCSITNADQGHIQYNWQDANVGTAGVYECEFVITHSNDKEETFPEDDDNIVVVIHEGT